jgi:hypothetical protein
VVTKFVKIIYENLVCLVFVVIKVRVVLKFMDVFMSCRDGGKKPFKKNKIFFKINTSINLKKTRNYVTSKFSYIILTNFITTYQ